MTTRIAHPRTAPLGTPAGFTGATLLRRLWTLLRVRADRKRLAVLDDHILHDIGLSRADAEAEAARPVWDVPAHWHRTNSAC